MSKEGVDLQSLKRDARSLYAVVTQLVEEIVSGVRVSPTASAVTADIRTRIQSGLKSLKAKSASLDAASN